MAQKWESCDPQSKRGSKTWKKKPPNITKGWFPNTQKIPYMLLLQFKDDFVEFQVVFLEHFKLFIMNKK
jgi:hypothetical protein